jgi:hypothetical protein
VTLTFKLDGFPSDISWMLKRHDDGRIVDSRPAGFYNKEREVVLHHVEVRKGYEYEFTMTDYFGDGLGGFVKLYYGKANIFGSSPMDKIAEVDGFVGHHYKVTFTARFPTSIDQDIAPTVPSPTPAPTGCVDYIDYETNKNPFDKEPIFTTAALEFGVSESICSYHSSYADCTNESREDCQWIFLTQGERKGKCRVDPIAKCLQKGTCVCNTEDFHGGDSNGILFHVPISITARDISPYASSVSYVERYEFPEIQNQRHPQDDSFFISKVDFTGRELEYSFLSDNPTVTSQTKSIFFKLHYLYTDVPIVGELWNGMGLSVSIDTSGVSHIIRINGKNYVLPMRLKIWTCTQIAITPDTLYVSGSPLPRVLSEELLIPPTGLNIRLGHFSGELFDVRVYSGISSQSQVFEVGARCASPNDPATIKKYEDIETHFLRWSCSEINPLAYRRVPTGGIQTYGSGAFATLWLAPIQDPLDENNYLNIPEGSFDEEFFFQHAKLQSYQWERHYFENDMIAFILEPYRMFSLDETQDWAVKTFNNPCRYIHQNNNDWDFPLYSDGIIPKWTAERYAYDFGGSMDAVFDLGMMYRIKEYHGYGFFTHEAFHQFHATLVDTYDAQPSGWMQESGAESAPAMLFPGGFRILAAVALAPAWPLGFGDTQYDASNSRVLSNPHIFTTELSLGNRIRGGHYYGTWILWWFLSEHAGLPHLLGQMFSVDRNLQAYWHGKLFILRLLLRSNNIDLGDAWSIFLAHFRTWDFKNGSILKESERVDFEWLKGDGEFSSDTTLEGRKTSATINPFVGTDRIFIPGPSSLRPTPFSWNCLTSIGIAPNKVIGITIRWDDGMGFASNTSPLNIVQQHSGCDEDDRFFQTVIVLHNPKTNERLYWKLKGKRPQTLYLHTGNNDSVSLHIILTPTPPVDYSGGRNAGIDSFVTPLPIYSYAYKVDIMNSVPIESFLSAPAEKEFGIVKFDRASNEPWFSSKCSCLDDPDDPDVGRLCLLPSFHDALPVPVSQPSRSPTSFPTAPPTLSPTTSPPTLAPTLAPTTKAPTRKPTPLPTTKAPTPAPTTKAPTNSPTTKAPTSKSPTRSPTSKAPTKQPTSKAPTPFPTKRRRFRDELNNVSVPTKMTSKPQVNKRDQ